MIQEKMQQQEKHQSNMNQMTMTTADENLASRFSNLSPLSLSAAVSSAFNLLKQKQMGNANAKQIGQGIRSDNAEAFGHVEHFRDISNSESYDGNTYRDDLSNYENEPDTEPPFYSGPDSRNKLGHFYQNQPPVLPILKCKYFESPINQSQIQYDCTAPIARNTPENNEVKLIEYRQSKVASFNVDSKELICLPQAFELFLKNLVGGLHTVYTKLKRLDIVPIVCNVEQVRVLRGLGAIQPGVNRCKLIAPNEFDILYEDCTNSGSRPGRPPKRHAQSDSENPNNDSQEKNSDSNLSPTNSSKASKSNCQTGHGKGLAIKANTSTDQHHTASSMSPYSILTSSSCSSSVPAMDTSDLASPSNQQAASLMQKFGFLPYPLNGFHSSNNSNKFLLKNPYETNGHQLGDDNMNGFGYDSESLNSINNAAAAYAIYGRMLQQQIPNFSKAPNQFDGSIDSRENPFNQKSFQYPFNQKSMSCNFAQSQCQPDNSENHQSQQLAVFALRNQHISPRKLNPNKLDLDVNTNQRNRHQDQASSKSVHTSKNGNSSVSTKKETESSLGSSNTSSPVGSVSRRTNLHPLSVESLTGGNQSHSESLSKDGEKLGLDLSAVSISYLIDTVKENVLQIEKSLKSDIQKLEKDLSVEKTRRVRSDVKINNLMRLQSTLRYKLKIQRSLATGRLVKRRSVKQKRTMTKVDKAGHE